ncbi:MULTISPECIES: site-specific integrase [Methylotenera]|jgi:integrase|uniref:site-specific integrase n=1 Tax=Methylotenera TaxID=359407 RepID=UPI0003780638|nr:MULTISPECIES: site-specific integrase [Methylotenera]MDP3212005.1 site-specific integrase [Methylotenera sp.]
MIEDISYVVPNTKVVSDLRRSYKITLIWGQINEEYKVPIFYDHKMTLAAPFVDYCIYLAKDKIAVHTKQQAYKSFIEPLSTAISNFLEFLRVQNIDWKLVDDSILSNYLNWSLEKTVLNSRSRNKLAASRTANDKLIKIYDFYFWAQNHALLLSDSIGWNNERIRSSLGKGQSDKVQISHRDSYPLCFRGVGKGSRVRESKYLSDNQIDKVVDELLSNKSSYLRSRNLLIFRIAESVGFRRESIASLKKDQFNINSINRAVESDTKFLVVPSKQKFGYQNSFQFPIALALKISKYCENERSQLLAKLSIDEKVANNAVFLSETTGAPIKATTITHVIGSAIKKEVPSKGMGPHALRDTFTTNRMAKEISSRKRNKFSLAPEDLALVLAAELGHKSITSQAPYTSAMKLVSEFDIEQTQSIKILELQMENDRIKLELQNLKAK